MGLGGWRQHYYDAEENEPASAALPIEAHVEELRDGVTAEIRAIFSHVYGTRFTPLIVRQ